MPLSISTAAIQEKNKLGSSDPWLLLMEVIYSGETPIRLAWNTENVTWDSETWQAASFQLGDIGESSEGEIPTVKLAVVDIERNLIPLIDEHGGGVGAEVWIRIIHSAYLTNLTPEFEMEFEILDATVDDKSVVHFTLGAENLSNYRSPPHVFLQSHCRYKEFKGTYCQYSGVETDCDRTFERCRVLGNQARFGGFPGIGFRSYWE